MLISHTLPADHAELVAAIQEHATATDPTHAVEVLDVLVIDEFVAPHTVEVVAEEFDATERTLLFEAYDVDTATFTVHEHVTI